MRIVSLAAVMAALLAATPAMAGERQQTVQFKSGASGSTIKDRISGDNSVAYTLNTGAGQVMQILFAPDNTSCYFNVFEPGADSAVHIGSTSGNEYGTGETKAGGYKVQVYLMRNAARRKERCNYSISFEVTGTPTGASAAMVSEDTMRKTCIGEVAGMYGVRPQYVELAPDFGTGDDGNKIMNGQVDKGSEGMKEFRCIFDASGNLKDVMAMTPDGE